MAGEIDLDTATHLRGAFDQAFQGEPETVVTDLSELTFMDSSGMHALIEAQHRAQASQIHFVVVPAAEDVHRPFALAGLDGLLALAPRAPSA